MASTILWISGLVMGMTVLLVCFIHWMDKAPLDRQNPRAPDTGSGSAPGAYGDSGGISCAGGDSSGGGGDGC